MYETIILSGARLIVLVPGNTIEFISVIQDDFSMFLRASIAVNTISLDEYVRGCISTLEVRLMQLYSPRSNQ